jgi:hypothetical protein
MAELRGAYERFMPELKEKGTELLDKLAELGRQISGSDKEENGTDGGAKSDAPPAEDENGK